MWDNLLLPTIPQSTLVWRRQSHLATWTRECLWEENRYHCFDSVSMQAKKSNTRLGAFWLLVLPISLLLGWDNFQSNPWLPLQFCNFDLLKPSTASSPMEDAYYYYTSYSYSYSLSLFLSFSLCVCLSRKERCNETNHLPKHKAWITGATVLLCI